MINHGLDNVMQGAVLPTRDRVLGRARGHAKWRDSKHSRHFGIRAMVGDGHVNGARARRNR
ncbi:hypothetical protein GCM10007857_07740 [Bradyrhizobium iriomotense]|uniref:Uncharacterized protein n=1 Tax=Bradyrhizobium iriomotense TaxID=441950 RepID=A0ABQ6ASY4_9BRAD|nr:hypothetical protein GCM10007857_07740 [Bradyrhizobium iriomotense]